MYGRGDGPSLDAEGSDKMSPLGFMGKKIESVKQKM
jgi:hypothetical protein